MYWLLWRSMLQSKSEHRFVRVLHSLPSQVSSYSHQARTRSLLADCQRNRMKVSTRNLLRFWACKSSSGILLPSNMCQGYFLRVVHGWNDHYFCRFGLGQLNASRKNWSEECRSRLGYLEALSRQCDSRYKWFWCSAILQGDNISA